MDSLLAPVLASSSRTHCRLACALRRLCGHWGVNGCLHAVASQGPRTFAGGLLMTLAEAPERAEGKVSFGSRTLRAVHPSIHPSIHPERYVCMYVCMYVYIYIYIHIYM